MYPLRGCDVTYDVTKPFSYIYEAIFAPGTNGKGLLKSCGTLRLIVVIESIKFVDINCAWEADFHNPCGFVTDTFGRG